MWLQGQCRLEPVRHPCPSCNSSTEATLIQLLQRFGVNSIEYFRSRIDLYNHPNTFVSNCRNARMLDYSATQLTGRFWACHHQSDTAVQYVGTETALEFDHLWLMVQACV